MHDEAPLGDQGEVEEALSEVQKLALRWLLAEGDDAQQAALEAEVRRTADLDNLVDACGWFASVVASSGPEISRAPYLHRRNANRNDQPARAPRRRRRAEVLDRAAPKSRATSPGDG